MVKALEECCHLRVSEKYGSLSMWCMVIVTVVGGEANVSKNAAMVFARN